MRIKNIRHETKSKTIADKTWISINTINKYIQEGRIGSEKEKEIIDTVLDNIMLDNIVQEHVSRKIGVDNEELSNCCWRLVNVQWLCIGCREHCK